MAEWMKQLIIILLYNGVTKDGNSAINQSTQFLTVSRLIIQRELSCNSVPTKTLAKLNNI